MASPDLGRSILIGSIRKTRNVFKNLRFCGKRNNCTPQLTSVLKRISGAANQRGGEYIWLSLFFGISTRWSSDVSGTVTPKDSMAYHLLIVCSGSIKSQSEKYLLCNAHAFWSKCVRLFFNYIIFFFNSPFYPDTYRTFFMTSLLIFKQIFSVFATRVYS